MITRVYFRDSERRAVGKEVRRSSRTGLEGLDRGLEEAHARYGRGVQLVFVVE